MAKRHYLRWPFDYDGRSYDRGQVVQLIGARNDERLIRLGYVGEVAPKTEIFVCGECGAEFVEQTARFSHGRDRHRDRALDPREEDRRADAQERMLMETAPLSLEKTEASMRG